MKMWSRYPSREEFRTMTEDNIQDKRWQHQCDIGWPKNEVKGKDECRPNVKGLDGYITYALSLILSTLY